MTLHIEPDKLTPLPTDLVPEEATTLRENMQIAGDTAALLEGLREHSGQSLLEESGFVTTPDEQDTDDQAVADEVFQAFAQKAKQQFEEAMSPEAPTKRKPGRPRKYPLAEDTPVNPPKLYEGNVAERIRSMLNEYNAHTVADVSELRMVITNKLLDLSMCGDPRIEIKATEMLGKISDVGLFTEKTEITVNYGSVADLDKAIKDKVRKMLLAHGANTSAIDIDIERACAARAARATRPYQPHAAGVSSPPLLPRRAPPRRGRRHCPLRLQPPPPLARAASAPTHEGHLGLVAQIGAQAREQCAIWRRGRRYVFRRQALQPDQRPAPSGPQGDARVGALWCP
jgi:hypothetical protein